LERLRRLTLEGSRASAALSEIGDFFEKKKEAVMSELINAATPEEAYAVACEARALRSLETSLKNAVLMGETAGKKIMNEEGS
jgi:hypothetical protein